MSIIQEIYCSYLLLIKSSIDSVSSCQYRLSKDGRHDVIKR